MAIVKSTLICLGTAITALALAFVGGSSPKVTAAEPAPHPDAEALAPTQSGDFGTIQGRLVWDGANAPEPKKLANINKNPEVCDVKPLYDQGLLVDPKTKGIKFGLAYVIQPKGKNAEAEKAILKKHPKVEIDQKNCEFIPHVTALTKDQLLVFKSSDPVGHNIRYSGFSNASKNVALQPNGNMEVKLVKEARPMQLNCDIHPWMAGWMMVFDHPFFAVTDDEGNFTITGVPAGDQNIIVWQEKVGYVTPGASKGMPVKVKAGEVTNVGDMKLDSTKVK
jgi:hypothetical protein